MTLIDLKGSQNVEFEVELDAERIDLVEQERREQDLSLHEHDGPVQGRAKGSRFHELKRLLPRHKKILELAVAGHSNKEIAECLGIHIRTVSMVVCSPKFQNQLARRNREIEIVTTRDVTENLRKAAEIDAGNALEATLVQGQLLESKNEDMKYKVTNSILNRVFRDKGAHSENEGPGKVVVNAASVNVLALAINESKAISRESE